MKSTRYIGRCYPGLVIFLIDQSSINLTQKKVETITQVIHEAIVELIARCAMGNGVSKRVFIMEIGYGRDSVPAVILKSGWVNQWAEEYDNPIMSIDFFESGKPSLSEALKFVKSMVVEWIKSQKEKQEYTELWGEDDDGFLAPITIINITKGGIEEDVFKIDAAAKEILRQQNTWLYHVMILDRDKETYELMFPGSFNNLIGCPYKKDCELLFDISSKLPEIDDSRWIEINKDDLSKDCRGLCVSYNSHIAKKIIALQCQEGDGTWGRPVDWMDMY